MDTENQYDRDPKNKRDLANEFCKNKNQIEKMGKSDQGLHISKNINLSLSQTKTQVNIHW